MYHPILRPGAQRQLKKIGSADLVIGLPSYKNTERAAQAARMALEGAHHYYPELRTVLVNADIGLKATTRRAIADQASDNGHHSMVVTGRYEGMLGQGSAIAALLDAALALDAKAIVILDSRTENIKPSWVVGLAHLILENKSDLVLPRYRQWTTSDGVLNDLITYPLFRALWGYSVRYPVAPDFALSPRLATEILDKDIWGTPAAGFGLPIWLATYSVLGSWRIAQSVLGGKLDQAEVTDSSRKQQRLIQEKNTQFKRCFQDIVSVMFSLVYKYRSCWNNVDRFRSLPTLTQFAADFDPAPSPAVDAVKLLDDLALGWMEYRRLWQQILTPDNLSHVEAIAALPPDRFYFPADLWARIIFDFSIVFNKGEADPAQIVASLFPIYQGRLAAFSQEVAGLAPVGQDGTVAAQAVEFEETRSYLKKRWSNYQPWRSNRS